MLGNEDSHDSMLWKELATLTCCEARVKKERKRKRETTDDLIGGDEGFFSQSSSVGAGWKAAVVNVSPPINPEDESVVSLDARVAFYNLIRYIVSLKWVSENMETRLSKQSQKMYCLTGSDEIFQRIPSLHASRLEHPLMKDPCWEFWWNSTKSITLKPSKLSVL